MGARTLEARLTGRLFALAGVVLVGVGIAAVVVTARVLEDGDTSEARIEANAARDALDRERSEGDSPEQARSEVASAAAAEGVRLWIGAAAMSGTAVAAMAPGACATIGDDRGEAWRVCAAIQATDTPVIAGVSIGAHRAVVASLARGMSAVIAVALLAMWLAVRRALRAPIAELSTVVAHELRTPLTAIVTELQTACPSDAATRAAVARVLGDAAHLADVIESILVLSSGAPVGRERQNTVVNVADLARELSPVDARVDAPDEALVLCDERLIRLAMRNLIENAAKYGGGARVVGVARCASGVKMSVLDDGPGLDAAARARMFDRYWRGSAHGHGLGLALVRAVAERHDGRAEAGPGPGGRGLVVSMTLGHLVGWHEHKPG